MGRLRLSGQACGRLMAATACAIIGAGAVVFGPRLVLQTPSILQGVARRQLQGLSRVNNLISSLPVATAEVPGVRLARVTWYDASDCTGTGNTVNIAEAQCAVDTAGRGLSVSYAVQCRPDGSGGTIAFYADGDCSRAVATLEAFNSKGCIANPLKDAGPFAGILTGMIGLSSSFSVSCEFIPTDTSGEAARDHAKGTRQPTPSPAPGQLFPEGSGGSNGDRPAEPGSTGNENSPVGRGSGWWSLGLTLRASDQPSCTDGVGSNVLVLSGRSGTCIRATDALAEAARLTAAAQASAGGLVTALQGVTNAANTAAAIATNVVGPALADIPNTGFRLAVAVEAAGGTKAAVFGVLTMVQDLWSSVNAAVESSTGFNAQDAVAVASDLISKLKPQVQTAFTISIPGVTIPAVKVPGSIPEAVDAVSSIHVDIATILQLQAQAAGTIGALPRSLVLTCANDEKSGQLYACSDNDCGSCSVISSFNDGQCSAVGSFGNAAVSNPGTINNVPGFGNVTIPDIPANALALDVRAMCSRRRPFGFPPNVVFKPGSEPGDENPGLPLPDDNTNGDNGNNGQDTTGPTGKPGSSDTSTDVPAIPAPTFTWTARAFVGPAGSSCDGQPVATITNDAATCLDIAGTLRDSAGLIAVAQQAATGAASAAGVDPAIAFEAVRSQLAPIGGVQGALGLALVVLSQTNTAALLDDPALSTAMRSLTALVMARDVQIRVEDHAQDIMVLFNAAASAAQSVATGKVGIPSSILVDCSASHPNVRLLAEDTEEYGPVGGGELHLCSDETCGECRPTVSFSAGQCLSTQLGFAAMGAVADISVGFEFSCREEVPPTTQPTIVIVPLPSELPPPSPAVPFEARLDEANTGSGSTAGSGSDKGKDKSTKPPAGKPSGSGTKPGSTSSGSSGTTTTSASTWKATVQLRTDWDQKPCSGPPPFLTLTGTSGGCIDVEGGLKRASTAAVALTRPIMDNAGAILSSLGLTMPTTDQALAEVTKQLNTANWSPEQLAVLQDNLSVLQSELQLFGGLQGALSLGMTVLTAAVSNGVRLTTDRVGDSTLAVKLSQGLVDRINNRDTSGVVDMSALPVTDAAGILSAAALVLQASGINSVSDATGAVSVGVNTANTALRLPLPRSIQVQCDVTRPGELHSDGSVLLCSDNACEDCRPAVSFHADHCVAVEAQVTVDGGSRSWGLDVQTQCNKGKEEAKPSPAPSSPAVPSKPAKPSKAPSKKPKPSSSAAPSKAAKPSKEVKPSASAKPSKAAKPSKSPKPSKEAKPSSSSKPPHKPKPSPSAAASPSRKPKPSHHVKASPSPSHKAKQTHDSSSSSSDSSSSSSSTSSSSSSDSSYTKPDNGWVAVPSPPPRGFCAKGFVPVPLADGKGYSNFCVKAPQN